MTRSSDAAPAFHDRYIPALDGIRGLAILVVLLHHFRFLFNPTFPFQFTLMKMLNLGWCGVQLFFVLSGFLITGILLDSRASPNYFTAFYARRFLRIFPLYYVYLAVMFAGSHLFHREFGGLDPLASVNPWWYLTYLQNFRPNSMLFDSYLAHLWSLAVEEQFYLVWPLLVWLLKPTVLTAICLAVIPMSLGIRLHYAGQTHQLSDFLNTFTPASLDCLACGALIALAIRSPIWRPRFARIARPLMLGCAIWFGILAWRAGGTFIYLFLIHTWGITALALLFAALVFVAATSTRGWLVGTLNLPGLRFTGRVSYGLYVLHPLVLALMSPVLAAISVPATLDLALNSEKVILVLMASIVLAAGSWSYFEKPILGLKKYFQYRQSSSSERLSYASRSRGGALTR